MEKRVKFSLDDLVVETFDTAHVNGSANGPVRAMITASGCNGGTSGGGATGCYDATCFYFCTQGAGCGSTAQNCTDTSHYGCTMNYPSTCGAGCGGGGGGGGGETVGGAYTNPCICT